MTQPASTPEPHLQLEASERNAQRIANLEGTIASQAARIAQLEQQLTATQDDWRVADAGLTGDLEIMAGEMKALKEERNNLARALLIAVDRPESNGIPMNAWDMRIVDDLDLAVKIAQEDEDDSSAG